MDRSPHKVSNPSPNKPESWKTTFLALIPYLVWPVIYLVC